MLSEAEISTYEKKHYPHHHFITGKCVGVRLYLPRIVRGDTGNHAANYYTSQNSCTPHTFPCCNECDTNIDLYAA